MEDVALEVGNVVVQGVVVLQCVGISAGIVEEVQGVTAAGLAQELAAGVVVAVGGAVVDGFAQPQSAGIVGEVEACGSTACGNQSPSLCPVHIPLCAVVVCGGIA